MYPSVESQVRELDRRSNDGIEVALLWHAPTNRVFVAVEDGRHEGESFRFEVDPRGALEAFRHPFAYAAGEGKGHAVAA
jgi:hypothetical protein